MLDYREAGAHRATNAIAAHVAERDAHPLAEALAADFGNGIEVPLVVLAPSNP